MSDKLTKLKKLVLIAAILTFALSSSILNAQGMHKKDMMMQKKKAMMMKMMKKMQAKALAKGYLKAHSMLQNPLDILGGPITIELSQEASPVYVALPDYRKLDPRIFGTVDMPRAFEGTPGITGVPVMAREHKGNNFTKMKMLSPFGDKHIILSDGTLEIKATDKTATDAAKSDDKVMLVASWKDKAGNTYTVKAGKVISHGLEFPTFGGVVTNQILHGFSGIGTPLMPSEYTYFAFWAMGDLYMNGKLVDKMRIVHGMLTEYVRTKGYKLGFDEDVTPTALQFHLMVPPFKPNMKTMAFDKVPVKTGFKLPNGMELPFWHVMFENVQVKGERK